MKKINCILLCSMGVLLLTACTSNEKNKLKEYGISDVNTCDNLKAVEANVGEDLVKDKGSVYCALSTDQFLDQANAFVGAGYEADRIDAFLSLPYYHSNLTKRYIAYDDGTSKPEDIVTKVNIGLDQPYGTDVQLVSEQSNTMLINKYHALPEGFVPSNLKETPSPCVIGEDYSCQSEKQYLVEEAADQFAKLVDAAKQQGATLKAIASYRSYAYQSTLYNYNVETQGQAYADTYYARPGQSEHNSGLAVDVMLDDINFNEIETSPHYDWLLEHIADYGFILRYPQDKVDITGYNYESWHLRYVGVEVASALQKSGLTLDEYTAREGD